MTDNPRITLACFGLVGTLIADDGVVDLAFAEAIATQGVVSGTSAFARAMARVHRDRGQSPADVLSSVFPGNQPRAQAALMTFERSLADATARTVTTPIPGAAEVVADLAKSGCRICVITNMPRPRLNGALQALGWRDVISVALAAEDVPRTCPSPDLALAAMLRVGVGDVREVAMIQATAAGVECGRRAGARIVAGVLTGPHPANRLRAAGATHVIDSVADLPAVLGSSDVGATQLPVPASISIPPQVPLERRILGSG
jgi:phosphoglycolate phosphatase